MILLTIAAIAAAYQILAILACVFRGRAKAAKGVGPVSVLKPVRGLDPGFREAIRSHTVLQGEYEFLCGVSQPNDPGLPVLREFYRVRVVESHTQAANGKVGVLMDLAAEAKHPILVVNDADIRVEPDYLTRVTAPLADRRVGLVTCLYRPVGDTLAARFEGLGVATDFAPSALVARLVGVDEFAMGSTLAFRREDLERIGGFAAVADYLADDYQLGHRIHALGLKCVLSDVVVETHLSGGWRQVWAHQVRWARTIRVSRFGGYLGLPITTATLWAVVCALCGRWDLAAALLGLRLAMAFAAGWGVLRSRDVLYLWWLAPARDLFGFAVWVAGLFGNSVVWRGRRLELDREGRIQAG
ncbi:MAG: glycosyltransferase [Acidobacteriota bacterium]|nr:glycosyltransferase [Acidobacteriota bacterium]